MYMFVCLDDNYKNVFFDKGVIIEMGWLGRSFRGVN